MHVAIVVQRFGKNIEGGAETHARLLAEQLVKTLRWQVTVFATSSQDAQTWQPISPSGTEVTAEGIFIHRFRVRQLRSPILFRLFDFLIAWLLKRRGLQSHVGRPGSWERYWFRLHGPNCPDLVDSLRRTQELFDAVVCFTCESFLTSVGMEGINRKIILVPMLFDEKFAYFKSTRRVVDAASHIAVNSEEELSLLRRIYPLQAQKARILAIGVEAAADNATEAGTISDLPETFVLYLGKISRPKQVDKLLRNFETFKRERVENDLHLVLAGKLESGFQIPDAPYFHYVGFVSDQEKLHLIRRAMCVLNSSPLENHSLIALEALAMGVPILGNEVSETLRYYMKWAPTVFGYRNEAGFIRQLNELTAINWQEDAVRKAQVEQSRRWVLETFSWTKVTDQFDHWLKS